MRGNDLHQILSEKSKAHGGYFRTSEYRLALFLLTPDVPEAERFIKASLRNSFERIGNLLNMLPPEQENYLLGDHTSPIRLGLERLIAVSSTLSGEGKLDSSLEETKKVLLDLIDDEAIRIIESNRAIRLASAKRVDRMPERLQKSRSLGEQALTRFLIEGQLDEDDWIRDANNYLDEVLQQPVGQRDPYTWLLYGWLNQRKDHREIAQNAFLQACLSASADRDILFVEANRILAGSQMDAGSYEAAYQTLLKVPAPHSDPTVTTDLLRAAIGCDRVDESRALVAELIPQWPLALLGMYSDPDILDKANTWRNGLELVADGIVKNGKQQVAHWQKTNLELQTSLTELEPGLELPVANSTAVNSMEACMAQPDVFSAHWVVSEARRGAENSVDAAKLVVKNCVKEKQVRLHQISARIDEVKALKAQQLSQLSSTKYHEQSAQRQLLGLNVADDRAQSGCMLSAGLGCAGYAAYFTVCFISAAISISAGPGTSTGKIIMGVIALPVAFGILFTIADGIRRMIAESELARQMKQIDERHEAAIANIEQAYKEKMPGLLEEMAEAKKEVDRGDAIYRGLGSKLSAPREAA